jgi:hypothetical protein
MEEKKKEKIDGYKYVSVTSEVPLLASPLISFCV